MRHSSPWRPTPCAVRPSWSRSGARTWRRTAGAGPSRCMCPTPRPTKTAWPRIIAFSVKRQWRGFGRGRRWLGLPKVPSSARSAAVRKATTWPPIRWPWGRRRWRGSSGAVPGRPDWRMRRASAGIRRESAQRTIWPKTGRRRREYSSPVAGKPNGWSCITHVNRRQGATRWRPFERSGQSPGLETRIENSPRGYQSQWMRIH